MSADSGSRVGDLNKKENVKYSNKKLFEDNVPNIKLSQNQDAIQTTLTTNLIDELRFLLIDLSF